ncbi:Hopanoid-associated sugar epimerase [Parasponia andersonii]|uniref:Hopanoid-associated sugar epimerase n=1 Tax=Parasponia andersonii TaxID=3476 RepID=A0A2P5CY62_PARAD|nr:Hopanoid-associated sugar epimerase [Parasponia andersonii]
MAEGQNPPYDLIIVGASGFTGKYVVKEALKFLKTPSSPLGSIALAGRNPAKLTQTLKWATHLDPPIPIPILTADTNDVSSVHHLCAQTKIILNCVGPFRLYGGQVVAACAEIGTDYLDMWRARAVGQPGRADPGRGLGGPDPEELGQTLTTLTENPGGLPGRNESTEHIQKREAFWSSVKPAHFGVKIGTKSLLGILPIMTVGVFIGIFGNFAFGRWLLLKFPSVFSLGWFRKKGPSEDEVRSATFKMWFDGFNDSSLVSQEKPKPNMEIVARVMGPEIGYLTTPISLVQCALILLNQRDNLPKGGIFTPGIVFGPMDLEERLQENGISFDVISKNAISA